MTYALSLAGADIVGKTIAVVWVTQENGGLDGRKGSAGKSSTCATADGVVHDLTSLYQVSSLFPSPLKTLFIPESNQ
jgi:hypothetical protein